jgi:hypothetical protein
MRSVDGVLADRMPEAPKVALAGSSVVDTCARWGTLARPGARGLFACLPCLIGSGSVLSAVGERVKGKWGAAFAQRFTLYYKD